MAGKLKALAGDFVSTLLIGVSITAIILGFLFQIWWLVIGTTIALAVYVYWPKKPKAD